MALRCQWFYRADLAFQRRRYERRKKTGICVKCGKISAAGDERALR
jgi:hypothetical protein